MNIAKYAIKRISRNLISSLALMLVALAFVLIIYELDYSERSQEAQLGEVYKSFEIKCVVSNLVGTKTDGLDITPTYVDACVDPTYNLSSYIKDVCLKKSMKYEPMQELYNDTYEVSGDPSIIGISRLEADQSLSSENGVKVSFDSGYGEEALNGNDKVCIIPDNIYDYLVGNSDGGVSLRLIVSVDEVSQWYTPVETELKVIGKYTNVTGKSQTIYCPWGTICDIAYSCGGDRSADSLSFTVKDNYKLEEFKGILADYFHAVDVSIGEDNTKYAIMVNDLIFLQSITSIERNINTLRALIPVIQALSIGIGFISGFLFIKSRKPEFAIMRSLGTGKGMVFTEAFFEQLILGILGACIGTFIFKLINYEANPGYINAAIYLICYLLGTAVAVLKISHINVMKIMKAKE